MLIIDTHKLSDKIATSPLHSVKDVTYGYIRLKTLPMDILHNFKQF